LASIRLSDQVSDPLASAIIYHVRRGAPVFSIKPKRERGHCMAIQVFSATFNFGNPEESGTTLVLFVDRNISC
jgi:hypothetical protein